MGNTSSHLDAQDIERILYPKTDSDPTEFIDTNIDYSQLNYKYQYRRSIARLNEQIEQAKALEQKKQLRKFIHRDLFTKFTSDRLVPQQQEFEEDYLIYRDLLDEPFEESEPIGKKSAEIDADTMRAFNISISSPAESSGGRLSSEFSDDNDNCFTPPSSTHTSWTTPQSSNHEQKSPEPEQTAFPTFPVVKAQLERTLNVPKRRSKGNLQQQQQQQQPQEQPQPRPRKRTKSLGDLGFKRISSLFKSSTPAIPDLPPDLEHDKIGDQAPQLDLPNLSSEQLDMVSLYRQHRQPPTQDDPLENSPTAGTAKDFDFLLDKSSSSSPPKPNRFHVPQHHRRQPSPPKIQRHSRSYKGKLGMSPRQSGLEEPVESVTQNMSMLHCTGANDVTIDAGIPPKVPPHRSISTSSITMNRKGLFFNKSAAGVSNGVSLEGDDDDDDDHADDEDNAACGFNPAIIKKGHKKTNSESSIASSIAIEPKVMNRDIYTRKCSFQRQQTQKRITPPKTPPEFQDSSSYEPPLVASPEQSAALLRGGEFMLPGYEGKSKLQVINASTDRLLHAEKKQELKNKRRLGRKFFSCYDRLNVDNDSEGLLTNGTTTDESEASSITGETFPTSSDFCHYFGLEMLSENNLRSGDLWNDRGQRFLSSRK